MKSFAQNYRLRKRFFVVYNFLKLHHFVGASLEAPMKLNRLCGVKILKNNVPQTP